MNLPDVTFKAKKKATLTAGQNFKKLKYLNNLLLSKKSCMIAMQDAQFVNTNKANTAIKTQIKKVAKTEKKILEKKEKIKEKEKAKLKKSCCK